MIESIQNNLNIIEKSSKCPECHGTGKIEIWETTDKSKFIYGDNREVCFFVDCPSCNGGLERRASEVRERANIPALYYDKSLDDFSWEIYKKDNKPINMERQKTFVMDFIDDYANWKKNALGLYIYSSTKGTGKTFLASCICRELMDRYAITTKFVQATSIIENSKKDVSFGEMPYIELLSKCELLVLDDIGVINNSYMDSLLFEILDTRYLNKLCTIITANVKPEGLINIMSERLTSRILSKNQPIAIPDYPIRLISSLDEREQFFKQKGLI